MANGEPIDAEFKTVASTPVDPPSYGGGGEQPLPPGFRPLLARDMAAIAFTLGLKIKGAGFFEAALWGLGARFAMQALNWPPNCVVASVGGVDPAVLLAMGAQYAMNGEKK